MDAIVKRSVVIQGHKTSVSLEAAFWTEAQRLAKLDGGTKSNFLTHIDRNRGSTNLSSSIRIAVLERVAQERDMLRDALMLKLRSRQAIAELRALCDGAEAGLMADRAKERSTERTTERTAPARVAAE